MRLDQFHWNETPDRNNTVTLSTPAVVIKKKRVIHKKVDS